MFCYHLPSQPGLVAQGWAASCFANGKLFLSADSHMSGSICLLPSRWEKQHITGMLYILRIQSFGTQIQCNPEGCRMNAVWGKFPPMTMHQGGVCQTNFLFFHPPMDQLSWSSSSLPTNVPIEAVSLCLLMFLLQTLPGYPAKSISWYCQPEAHATLPPISSFFTLVGLLRKITAGTSLPQHHCPVDLNQMVRQQEIFWEPGHLTTCIKHCLNFRKRMHTSETLLRTREQRTLRCW